MKSLDGIINARNIWAEKVNLHKKELILIKRRANRALKTPCLFCGKPLPSEMEKYKIHMECFKIKQDIEREKK